VPQRTVIRPAACSAFHRRIPGRTSFSRDSTISAVMRLCTSFLSVVFCIVISFKNNFLPRETRDGLRAFSGADLSRARFVRVHRRPLTGSTAGRTPVVRGRGFSEEQDDFELRTPYEGGTLLFKVRRPKEVQAETGNSNCLGGRIWGLFLRRKDLAN
jgi:hypothetical protein